MFFRCGLNSRVNTLQECSSMLYNQWQKTFPYSEHKCVSYSSMYQLFFWTTNLLLSPLLHSYSFFSHRALNNVRHLRYLAEFWICFTCETGEKYLYIRKCNNITNSKNIWRSPPLLKKTLSMVFFVNYVKLS